MSEKNRLVKNTLLIAIGNFGAKLVSFILLPLYTSLLSTTEYGVYDYIVTISTFLLPVVTFSMHEAMFRFIIDAQEDKNKFKKIISNSLFAVLFGVVVLSVVLLTLHFILNKGNDFLLIYIMFYVAATSLYTFANNLLRGLGRIKAYATISCLKNTLQLALNVIVIVVFKLGMQGLIISLCISEIIAFIIVAFIAKIWKYIDIKSITKKEINPMMRYSLPLIPNALCSQIINISDRIVITNFMTASANGIYSISYKFPNMIETVYHYFYTAWSESASRVFVKGKEKALEYYQSLYNTLNNLIFSLVIVLIAAMPVMFRVFIRGNYIEGFKYVPILMLSMYFDCMAKFYSGIFTALKKTKVMASTTIIAAIINLAINIALIYKIGLYAAAISTLIAEIVLVVLRKHRLKEYMNITTPIKKVLIMILMVAIVALLYNYNNWIMIGSSISISLVYAIITNRSVIKSMFNKMKNKLFKHKKVKVS